MVPQNSYNNNRDHGPQVTITNTIVIKSVKIVKELAKCDTDTPREQMLLKMVSTALLDTGLPQSSICRKHSYL